MIHSSLAIIREFKQKHKYIQSMKFLVHNQELLIKKFKQFFFQKNVLK